jgi:myosin heavy subunit
MAATLVWLYMDSQWIAASLVRSVAGPQGKPVAVCLREDTGVEVTVPGMHHLPREVLPAEGVDDLTQLSYLHEPAILDTLRRRFKLGQTEVGIYRDHHFRPYKKISSNNICIRAFCEACTRY